MSALAMLTLFAFLAFAGWMVAREVPRQKPMTSEEFDALSSEDQGDQIERWR